MSDLPEPDFGDVWDRPAGARLWEYQKEGRMSACAPYWPPPDEWSAWLESPAGTPYPWPLCEEGDMTDLLWLKHHVYNLHLNYMEPCGCSFCQEYRQEFGEDPTPVGPWNERHRAPGEDWSKGAGLDMRCPTCNSPNPRLHPATQHEGEVSWQCGDEYHRSTAEGREVADKLDSCGVFRVPVGSTERKA